MDLYTLDSAFLKENIVDDFISAIWTERYIYPGDAKLVLPANSETINRLTEGTFLACKGSKEVMILENQSIENGLLTVTGQSLLSFLNKRNVYSSIYELDRYYSLTDFTAGDTIALLVYRMCINATDIDAIGGDKNEIPGLTLGSFDLSGPNITVAIPFGPLLDGITPVAEYHNIGMSLYLDSSDGLGYVLKFTTYKGLDRTSGQDDRPLVRFAPETDSLMKIKELRSINNYKNVAYVFPPVSEETVGDPGVAYALLDSDDTVGFQRRVSVKFNDDISDEMIVGNPALVDTVLIQNARDEIVRSKYIRLIDGEIVPLSTLTFGQDYFLGDLVELQSNNGFIQPSIVSEYIRSQDETGEHAYPTVSVIDTD